MATLVLGAVGAAVGSTIGGGVLGLPSVVIGRAIGASVGRVIDQRLMGGGSTAVETGRVDRFRLSGASEGAALGRVWGRMRVAGQVIWATRFSETRTVSGGGGGKGAPRPATPEVTSYAYSVSLAIALCEGPILRVGRIWADGKEIARDSLTLRVYRGDEDQLPDPKIAAVEGEEAPAYRGIAYVVIEDLDLGRFGNRVPVFNFEVVRGAAGEGAEDLAQIVRGVALIPGTGEYALATTPLHRDFGGGQVQSVNVNTASGQTDFATSLEALSEGMPACGATALVVSWFGDDLRCGACTLKPKVEDSGVDATGMAWRAGGLTRAGAEVVPADENGLIYGGTPADGSVVEAIAALKAAGQAVTFYPFILMQQLAGNGLPDPYGASEQPALPWRGRITASLAPGQPGSPDGTAAADAEVAAFFGSAAPGDFTVSGTDVSYNGPAEFSYRRMILHYAHLCAAAGGVDAFCIGSEMRGLTTIRGAAGFPAVAALRALAADVRAILGPAVKLGYAADWSEYFGYHPQDGSGDVYFHLDPLWADDEIDFIGIDNYMPLSDWRDGPDHADAHFGSIYNLEYLRGNVAGGEGYDWYYAGAEAEAIQRRSPIEDGAHGEPWVFRYKDLRGWWENDHHERIGGVRQATATGWVPRSKPFWFTEFGCAAIDKGTNQPNRFLDARSSESGLPRASDGRRDDLIQVQYLRAVTDFWSDPEENPVSELYGGPMVEMDRAHVWAWDARPFPAFPALTELWSDGVNHARGHWLNGRESGRTLASVVREICEDAGLAAVEADRLHGLLRGYQVSDVDTARAALQPLMLAYGFEAIERDGALHFQTRDAVETATVDPARVAVSPELGGDIELSRAAEPELSGRVRLTYVEADGAYGARVAEAVFPDAADAGVSGSELALALTGAEARGIAERWLAEARLARDRVRLALPPSRAGLGAGDVLRLDGGLFRLDRVERGDHAIVEGVRVAAESYTPSDAVDEAARAEPFVAPLPVLAEFLDLPLLKGDEVEHAPHVAVTARPWPGAAAVYDAPQDAGYALNTLVRAPAVMGETLDPLLAAAPGRLDRGAALRVRLYGGTLASATEADVLAGANAAAIGAGGDDAWEVFQFTGAELVGEDTWALSGRLRGQAGTDALMPDVWPVGSRFVLLDGAAVQIGLAPTSRGLARHYRVGPAARPVDDPSYTASVRAFAGVGLRPLAPVHLRAALDALGDLQLSWVRRTRIDGDGWEGLDVPLGEASEAYLVRVRKDAALVREATVSVPAFTYSGFDRAVDGIATPYAIEVAQISDRFGPGLFRRIEIDG